MSGNIFAGLAVKFIMGAIVAVLLGSGVLYAGCRIKSCIMAEHKVQVLEESQKATERVYQADQKSRQTVEEMTDEELLEFGRTGNLPERLRHQR